MTKELKMLELTLSLDIGFFCGLILVNDDFHLDYLKESLQGKASFFEECSSLSDVILLKDRIMEGEKVIVSNLDSLYQIFAVADELHNGVFLFYQRFTEAYRDRLWKNNQGQVHFVVNEEVRNLLDDDRNRYNHFHTMIQKTFDLSQEKVFIKK